MTAGPASLPVRVLALTNGSRGDVQPFMALSLGLQRAGFIVRVLTNHNLVEFFARHGVDAVSNEGGSWEYEQRNRPELQKALQSGDSLGFFKAMGAINKEHFPSLFKTQLAEIRGFKPDLIIASGLYYWHTRALGIAWDIPVMYFGLQAVFPTGYETSMLGEPSWFPRCLHLACNTFQIWIYIWMEWSEKFETIREMAPEIIPFLTGPGAHFADVLDPTVQGVISVSPHLYQRGADWPESLRPVYTGAWIVPADEQRRRMKEGAPEWGGETASALWEFLDAGAPPVYLGWGSMMAGAPENTALLAVRTLMKVGVRGVILGGWAKLNVAMLEGQPDSAAMKAYCENNVLFVHAAPHEALFPRCAVVVHHGGAATTACSLRSGVTTIITPVFMDQFPNADMVQRNGVGLRLRPLPKVSVAELSRGLRRCLDDVVMHDRCKAMGEQLRKEDGVGNAVQEVQRFLSEDVATGRFREKVARQCLQVTKINARPPGLLTWLWRVFLSPAPNNIAKWVGELPKCA